MQRLLENKTAVDSSTVLLIMCVREKKSIVGSSIDLGTEYCRLDACLRVCVCVYMCWLACHSVSKIVLLKHNEVHSTLEPPPVSRIVLCHRYWWLCVCSTYTHASHIILNKAIFELSLRWCNTIMGKCDDGMACQRVNYNKYRPLSRKVSAPQHALWGVSLTLHVELTQGNLMALKAHMIR